MPTAAEALGQQSQMRAALEQGVETISDKETVTFQRYTKWVFQVDGFVFWVASGQFTTAVGSLHYATDRQQDDDQTIGTNHFLLTSETEITQFNAVDPQTMFVGTWQISGGAPLQVAFASRGNYFAEADLWHYSGFAVYPALSAQLVNSAADLPQGPIVSNSMPIWLAQNAMAPVYPAFLVPDNIVPPYIVADIDPAQTEALGSFPVIGPWPGQQVPNSGGSPLHLLDSFQLMRDRVKLTLYGFNNAQAVTFLANLIDASIDPNSGWGWANSPQIRDERRGQVEVAALAQKKSIEVVANYLQGAADVIARRLILAAGFKSLTIIGGAPAFGIGAIVTPSTIVNGSGRVA